MPVPTSCAPLGKDYEDEKGFCASVPIQRVAVLDYVLTPGRHVGLPGEEADFDFAERFAALKAEFECQLEEEAKLNAAVAVNIAILELYWFLDEQILERQVAANWGDVFLEQLSRDLLAEFPEVNGFSRRNLEYMRQWVIFWRQLPEFAQQPVSQLEIASPKAIAKHAVSQSQPSAKQLDSQLPWGS